MKNLIPLITFVVVLFIITACEKPEPVDANYIIYTGASFIRVAYRTDEYHIEHGVVKFINKQTGHETIVPEHHVIKIKKPRNQNHE